MIYALGVSDENCLPTITYIPIELKTDLKPDICEVVFTFLGHNAFV